MNRTEYKNNFYKEHYERISLAVPKGMKNIIKALASNKGMSVNSYIQDLVRKDQCGMFDTMQIAEKCLAQDFKSLAQDHISFVTYLLLTCYLPLKFCVILYCLIGNSEYKKTPETRCFRGISLFCNILLNYLLLNCGARRAAFKPYFFLSFILGSRVR